MFVNYDNKKILKIQRINQTWEEMDGTHSCWWTLTEAVMVTVRCLVKNAELDRSRAFLLNLTLHTHTCTSASCLHLTHAVLSNSNTLTTIRCRRWMARYKPSLAGGCQVPSLSTAPRQPTPVRECSRFNWVTHTQPDKTNVTDTNKRECKPGNGLVLLYSNSWVSTVVHYLNFNRSKEVGRRYKATFPLLRLCVC